MNLWGDKIHHNRNVYKIQSQEESMKKVYSEIGFGNESFLSTEFEEGKKEYRVNKFIFPIILKEVYIRLWIFNFTLSISFFEGISFKKKDRFKFKFLLGFGGTC